MAQTERGTKRTRDAEEDLDPRPSPAKKPQFTPETETTVRDSATPATAPADTGCDSSASPARKDSAIQTEPIPVEHCPIEVHVKPSSSTVSGIPPAQMSLGTRATDAFIPPTCKKHPRLYFDDGSVVLVAENTLFRVHRSVLSKHSSFFRVLFELPQPSGEPTYDGVPLVHLPGDDVTEVAHMLNALYNHNYIDTNRRTVFEKVIALLKMGTKYDVRSIREEALEQLMLTYPCSLGNFDSLVHDPSLVGPSVGREVAEHFVTINAARVNNVPAVLPAAFYYAAQAPLEDIIHGCIWKAGGGKRVQLSPGDIVIVLKGRQELMSARRKYVFKFLHSVPVDGLAHRKGPFRDCLAAQHGHSMTSSPETCIEFLMRMIMEFSQTGFFEGNPRGLDGFVDETWQAIEVNLCERCRRNFKGSMDEGRERVWELLPKFFGLDTWTIVMSDEERAEKNYTSEESEDDI